jgi:hypothetical protein
MIQNGTDFTCTIHLRNISHQTSTVNVTVVASSTEYTGRMKALVKREKLENITVPAGESMYNFVSKCSLTLNVKVRSCTAMVVARGGGGGGGGEER